MIPVVLTILAAGGVLLTLFAMPVVGTMLLRTLQIHPPLAIASGSRVPGAIVVLGGDMSSHAPEYGGSTVGRLTLERLRMAARLHRLTRAPVLVTGGRPPRAATALGELMRESLERDFGVPVRWVEPAARNTHENARLCVDILRAHAIGDIVVVTHAWHMRRAMIAFDATGLTCVPAPIGTRNQPTPVWSDFRPGIAALQHSFWALHEWRSIVGTRLVSGYDPMGRAGNSDDTTRLS